MILQPDEVRVLGQSDIDTDNALDIARKEVWIYTAVVSEGEKNYYFSADNAAELVGQVGGMLAVLSVHKGMRELCLLGDGARWQRNWYREDRKSVV